jgi:PAS domain S-box-containing protein
LVHIFDISKQKKAEEALQESEEKYRSLTNNINVGIYRSTPGLKGKYIEVNPAMYKMFGYSSKTEFLKISPVEIYQVPKDRERFSKKVLRLGMVKNEELDLKRKSGTPIICSTTAIAVRDQHGKVNYIDGMDEDISERKQAVQALLNSRDYLEQRVLDRTTELQLANLELQKEIKEKQKIEIALRASEANYRGLVKNMLEGVYQTLPNGKIISANQALVDILGFDSEEEMCRKIKAQELYVNKKDRVKYIRILEKEGSLRNFELELRCKDGREIIVLENARIVRDDQGKVLHYEGVLTDITERKQAEKALRDSEEKYRELVERANDGITIVQDAKLKYLNDKLAAMLGYTIEEMIDTPFADYIWPDELQLINKRYHQRMAGKKILSIYESVLKDKSGEKIHVEINAGLIQYQGNVANLVYVRDISERKKAEEEQQKLQIQIQHTQKLESLGILAGGIAHDFNNLLMGIQGNANLALIKLPAGIQANKYIKKIEKASQQLATLTNQMLAYSGKGRFVLEILNLSTLVEEMTQLLKVTISKKVTLRYNLEKQLPDIEADAAQIRQVVMNLIVNASEAIGDKTGVISVKTGILQADSSIFAETYLDQKLPEGKYVFLEVSDTGAGMDEQTKNKIFDPFFTTKFSGRGLGLAAVLGIVRGHRGTIQVFSKPAKGTTLKVLFPAVKKNLAKRSDKSKKGEAGVSEFGTILIVDDEAVVRDVAGSMVENAGFRVLKASDGRKGVEVFKKNSHKIIAVILDTTMPNMNGEETFRELRRLYPTVKVILSSGYNEQEATSHFVGKGLAGFIQKPYTQNQLIQKVKEVIGMKP